MTADWLDENDEPELADAFRWVCRRADVKITASGGQSTREWQIEGMPNAVSSRYTVYGYDVSTLPGLAASVAGALKKVREDLQ